MTTAYTAPELALLRVALQHEGSGYGLTVERLATKTVVVRGILLNPLNRTRYARHIGGLVTAGLLEVQDGTDLAGSEQVGITARGREVLAEQQGTRL